VNEKRYLLTYFFDVGPIDQITDNHIN